MILGKFEAFLLALPALALLLLAFFIPLGWFLSDALREPGSLQAVAALASGVISSSVMIRVLINSNLIAAVVTVTALILSYPIAFALTRLGGLRFRILLACVILPYFTSVVVRTYAWMVLLGRLGLINRILLGVGLSREPVEFLYNWTGVVIGMTYVLMPYMVLTLYSAMKSVDSGLLKAAASMGAYNMEIFRKVFFPLTKHGVLAGTIIVYMLALGYFITPALMGGPSNMMIGTLIDHEIEVNQDWTSAAIMTLILLAMTLVLYGLYRRTVDLAKTGSAA